MSTDAGVEDLLRQLAPQVLGALVRRYGHFDACEDAVQEALLAAAVQWPEQGVPENPRGWLITVASRRLTDQLRSEQARRRRGRTAPRRRSRPRAVAPAPDDDSAADRDDTLTLLFLCCHPALSPASQIALTLRAVGGLTTAQIARAFLVPEATMAQRISRAKQRIKAAGAAFRHAPEPERAERLGVVLHVLYLIFNEGYTATSGPTCTRADLTAEAIRLTRAVHRLLPGRRRGGRAARADAAHRRAPPGPHAPDGALVPLAEQDRGRWNADAHRGGRRAHHRTLCSEARSARTSSRRRSPPSTPRRRARRTPTGRRSSRCTSCSSALSPNPMVTLNHAVAVAMVRGPQAGLDLLGTLDADERMAGHHRLDAVRAHLLEMAGDHAAARGQLPTGRPPHDEHPRAALATRQAKPRVSSQLARSASRRACPRSPRPAARSTSARAERTGPRP